MKKYGNGKSSAKIIWFGEHSVVYEQPAIALPLSAVSVSAQISFNENNEPSRIYSRYYDGLWRQLPRELAGIKQMVIKILSRFDKADQAFTLTIESEIPSERGMGSSAATAVAIARATFNLFDKNISRNQLLQYVDIEEQITHGNPSGLDAATASSKWPIWYVKGAENMQLDMNLAGAFLVIADSGIKGKTSEAVANVSDQMTTDYDKTNSIIMKMGQIASAVPPLLLNNDIDELGNLMNANHNCLRQLHVSNQQLDKLQRVAVLAGAKGAKLTGSGLGGCLIALSDSAQNASLVAKQLEKHGATKTWIQPLGQF